MTFWHSHQISSHENSVECGKALFLQCSQHPQVNKCRKGSACSYAHGEAGEKPWDSYHLVMTNIAMENDPFIHDFPIKTSIYRGFSMAMLNNQMVYAAIMFNPFEPRHLWIFIQSCIIITSPSFLEMADGKSELIRQFCFDGPTWSNSHGNIW